MRLRTRNYKKCVNPRRTTRVREIYAAFALYLVGRVETINELRKAHDEQWAERHRPVEQPKLHRGIRVTRIRHFDRSAYQNSNAPTGTGLVGLVTGIMGVTALATRFRNAFRTEEKTA